MLLASPVTLIARSHAVLRVDNARNWDSTHITRHARELDAKKHLHGSVELEGETELKLDMKQHGIGSASCGPGA